MVDIQHISNIAKDVMIICLRYVNILLLKSVLKLPWFRRKKLNELVNICVKIYGVFYSVPSYIQQQEEFLESSRGIVDTAKKLQYSNELICRPHSPADLIRGISGCWTCERKLVDQVSDLIKKSDKHAICIFRYIACKSVFL